MERIITRKKPFGRDIEPPCIFLFNNEPNIIYRVDNCETSGAHIEGDKKTYLSRSKNLLKSPDANQLFIRMYIY